MSDKHEEQPNFKVTDRRLFNADGTPRDLPPEEHPQPQASAVVQEQVAASEAAKTEATPPTASGTAPHEEYGGEEELTEEEIASAQDPASFLNFLMSIASNAASALGMMEHPVTHQREVQASADLSPSRSDNLPVLL